MPRAGVAICAQRLAPAHFQRAAVLAEVYSPDRAVEAGFLDRVVAPAEPADEGRRVARELAMLDRRAHARTKLRARRPALTAIRRAIGADTRELAALGIRRAFE